MSAKSTWTAASSAETFSAFAQAGIETRVRLRSGEILFARVVVPVHHNRVTLRPWGSTRDLDVDLKDISRASVASVSTWRERHDIATKQRAKYDDPAERMTERWERIR